LTGPYTLSGEATRAGAEHMFVNERDQEISLASKLMFVFMSFETGHPDLAFIAIDWKGFVDARYLGNDVKMH
jgi:hypothetical protein